MKTMCTRLCDTLTRMTSSWQDWGDFNDYMHTVKSGCQITMPLFILTRNMAFKELQQLSVYTMQYTRICYQ